MPSADAIADNSQALLDRLAGLGADELAELVRHHNAAYWDRNDPEIDDIAFDKLVEALRKVDPGHAALEELGASPAVDDRGRRFAEVVHERPMLSLDKCYDDATLLKWKDKVPGAVVVTPKIDGVACAIRYDEEGKLTVCATRGNGKVGDDITANATQIPDIPHQLPKEHLTGPVEVRGEVYMKLSRFNEAYAKDYPNPRNLTAGALKQREAEKSRAYGLSFFSYGVHGTDHEREQDRYAWLAEVGFTPPPWEVVEDADRLGDAFRAIDARRGAYDYELDGVVMMADDAALQQKLGFTAHHPRYAIAYKFQGEGAQTKLREVEWSVARSGAITPVAIVEPVFISGVTVSRASLHHAGYLDKLGLTEGCTVEVVRRGGVIPKIERVLAPGGEKLEPPTRCPGGYEVMRDGDFLFCSHADTCPVVLRSRIKHFNKAIDLIGFGEKHLTKLYDKGLVTRPVDLYRLKLEDLTQLERLAERSATKLLAEVDGRRKLPIAVFLTALGIEEVGLTVAETITETFDTWEKLEAATEDDVAKLHGIGESIAHSLVAGLRRRKAEIDELREEVEILAATPMAPADDGHPLAGKAVVFTGKMAQLDRKSAQKMVKDKGGRTPSSVSKELDFLVIGDDGSPLLGDGKKSTKQKTAEKLIEGGASIAIISETDFLAMAEGAAGD